MPGVTTIANQRRFITTFIEGWHSTPDFGHTQKAGVVGVRVTDVGSSIG